jgi:hypothetical protein
MKALDWVLVVLQMIASKHIKINGYSAYGTKDGTFKHSIGTAVNLNTYSNTWLSVSYTNDVVRNRYNLIFCRQKAL